MKFIQYLRHLIRPEYIHRPTQILRAVMLKIQPVQDRVEAVLPWGLTLNVNPNEYIGRRIVRDGIYALEACEACFRLLKSGDVALDIGANQGLVTSAMAYNVGSDGKVIAIEMMPDTYAKLQHNVGLWGEMSDRVQTIQTALSSEDFGSISAYISSDFEINSGVAYISPTTEFSLENTLQVPCSRLDALLPLQKVKLLKLDVETHEYDVLKGAGKWITEKWITHIVFEDLIEPTTDAKNLLRENGYRIYRLHMNLASPSLELVEVDTVTHPNSANCVVDYIATVDENELEQAFSRPRYLCLS